MKEVVLATLEGLEEVVKDKEEPSVFWQGEWDTLIILGSDSGIGGVGEGSRGGWDGDKPTDLELGPLDSKEEEDDEEEEMANKNLELITQGQLAFPGALHNMPKLVKKMSINFKPNNTAKAEDHLDSFYL